MTFATELLDAIGTATDAWDIRAATRRCWFYDIDGYPLRIWDGMGVLYADATEWLGTIDQNGTNHHQAPPVRDMRDGASPEYRFTIPYVDLTAFNAMKADQDLVKGRKVTCYRVIVLTNEGLRPGTALQFAYRLTMRGAEFSERMEGGKLIRSASGLCRGNDGRAKLPAGTMTDAAQQERARVLGLASDSGCAFVAANSNRTYVIGG